MIKDTGVSSRWVLKWVGGAAGCLWAASALALPSYSCVRLHDKIGRDGVELDANSTRINRRGEVSGWGRYSENRPESSAVWWTKSLRQRRVPFGNAYDVTRALSINDAGHVVGYVESFDNGVRPFLWNGVETGYLAPLAPYETAAAHGINNVGQVVGSGSLLRVSGPEWHGVMWDKGIAIDLGTLSGGKSAMAVDINDEGVAVGKSDSSRLYAFRAVRWDRGGITDLGTLPGGSQSEATAINSQGLIVGRSMNSAGRYRAVAWTGSEVIDLGVLAGHQESLASGVNRSGTVVGHSIVGLHEPQLAVVWFGLAATPVDLNMLIDGGGCVDEAGTRWVLTSATGINVRGEIAATSQQVSAGGRQQSAAFRLTPD